MKQFDIMDAFGLGVIAGVIIMLVIVAINRWPSVKAYEACIADLARDVDCVEIYVPETEVNADER